MTEIKEPEEAVSVIMDVLQFLQETKVKVERPVPIVKDRQGRLAKDLTMKEWLNKGHEEIMELQDALANLCPLDDKPSRYKGIDDIELQDEIVGEACDVVEWVYSFMNQFGFTPEVMSSGVHKTNEKLKERGCI
jgi:hypothetical protein